MAMNLEKMVKNAHKVTCFVRFTILVESFCKNSFTALLEQVTLTRKRCNFQIKRKAPTISIFMVNYSLVGIICTLQEVHGCVIDNLL